jgi:serine phosphatase RsbU (regulator of sigma subunit)
VKVPSSGVPSVVPERVATRPEELTEEKKRVELMAGLKRGRRPLMVKLSMRVLRPLVVGTLVGLVVTPWQQSVAGQGRVIALSPAERHQRLESPVDGRISRVLVMEGQQVETDEIVIEIADVDPRFLERLQSEADLITLREQAASARRQSIEDRVSALVSARDLGLTAADARIEMGRERNRQAEQAVIAAEAATRAAGLNLPRITDLAAQGLRSTRDLELAQRVQQGLLPSRPPDLPGYEIFDHYESARHVGGDFFAYVPLADDRLAVVLADVSGKGISAALLMAALSADVRYCLASERDLGRAVARINETFLRGGWDDRFATLVVAVLDPARHVATICNAGHLPVFRCGPNREVETVAADLGGLPLGMAPPGDYRSCEVPLAPGATLLFCTDGISEALDHEQRCYGFERMEAVLAEASGPAEIGRRLLADVRRHAAGQVQSDDICVVCVGRLRGTAHPAQRPGPERDGGIVQARG